MIGTLILTHGGLARELLAAAAVIVGPLGDFEALSPGLGRLRSTRRAARSRDVLARLDAGRGRAHPHRHVRRHAVATPALPFLEPGQVEMVDRRQPADGLRLGLPEPSARTVDRARRTGSRARRSESIVHLASDPARGLPSRRRPAAAAPGARGDRAARSRSSTASACTRAPRPSWCTPPAASEPACTLVTDGEEVDAKSILGVLLLAAAQGTRLTVRCDGPRRGGGAGGGHRADRRPLRGGELSSRRRRDAGPRGLGRLARRSPSAAPCAIADPR